MTLYMRKETVSFLENDGEVSFSLIKAGDGYYGRTFNIRMKDGSEKI